MNSIPTNKIVVTGQANGHVSATYNNALIYNTYQYLRDARLSDMQVKAIIEAGVMPGYWERHADYPRF
jgi:hypothetical protein